jgi:hypothetical protein
MPDDEMLDPEAEEVAQDDADQPESGEEGFLDKLRDTSVGTEDPNIVGDVGPTDIPPGRDPQSTPLVTTDEPVDHLEV